MIERRNYEAVYRFSVYVAVVGGGNWRDEWVAMVALTMAPIRGGPFCGEEFPCYVPLVDRTER